MDLFAKGGFGLFVCFSQLQLEENFSHVHFCSVYDLEQLTTISNFSSEHCQDWKSKLGHVLQIKMHCQVSSGCLSSIWLASPFIMCSCRILPFCLQRIQVPNNQDVTELEDSTAGRKLRIYKSQTSFKNYISWKNL